MTLKLGIIGMSDGNGHPYSWSAIFNGYNHDVMKGCGYPVIPEYLRKQNWPNDQIKDARVTSVWTQDKELTNHIAKASLISNPLSNIAEMIEYNDAILLARDDAENHLKYAKVFLEAGMPIYIDKPIALSVQCLKDLYMYEQYKGQIFTCSALRYSPDLMLSDADKSKLGDIISIEASTPKSWEKYAVHIIEPVINILDKNDHPVLYKKLDNSVEQKRLKVKWKSGVETIFTSLGNVDEPIMIKIFGKKSSQELIFSDSFNAFKNALQDFIDGIINNDCNSPYKYNEKVVNIIEQGMKT
tara:strand:- start:131 stop:1027 length:897 start_codon:yes stop_codon:yes gene_type:complete